jgi:hypothetical protein
MLTINNAHSVNVYEPVDGTIDVTDKSSGANVTTEYTGILSLVVNGTRGDDIIIASVYTVNATFNGGAGADEIGVTANATANIVVHGGSGDDLLGARNNGTGTVVVYGDTGNDTFKLYPGTGSVVFHQ